MYISMLSMYISDIYGIFCAPSRRYSYQFWSCPLISWRQGALPCSPALQRLRNAFASTDVKIESQTISKLSLTFLLILFILCDTLCDFCIGV